MTARAELAIRGYLAAKEEAAKDPAKFFSFCMVDPDDPRRRLRCEPHQAFGFEFVMHHPICVLRWPTDTGKSLFSVALSLFLVGQNPDSRGLIVGKVGEIAQRQIAALRAYLDPNEPLNQRVRSVFPHLRLSSRESDPNNKSQLTTEREAAALDPTFIAFGLDSSKQGKKPKFVICDDLLDDDNTRSPESRNDVKNGFEKRILGRLPPEGGRCVLTNVPWHREDLTYLLEESGVPTIEMDVYGNVKVANAAPDFESDLVRPSHLRDGQWHRLTAYDPDLEEKSVLFPARWPLATINKLRYGDPEKQIPPMPTRVFAQQKLCQPSSSEDERCPLEWWVRCHVRGLERQHSFKSENVIVSGFDLGWGKKKSSGKTTLVTYERLGERKRRFLWAESWPALTGPALVRRIYDVLVRYGGWIGVEAVAAQKYILDFCYDDDPEQAEDGNPIDDKVKKLVRSRVLPYETGGEKHDPIFGVETLFGEVEQRQWEVPCGLDGRIHPEFAKLQDQARGYDPREHTGDHLMAWWIARRIEERVGPSQRPPRTGGRRAMAAQARQTLRGGGDPLSAMLARAFPQLGRTRL